MPTRWKPDTCGCEININEDESVTMVTPCPDHLNDSGQVVLNENQGRNRLFLALHKLGINSDEVEWYFERQGRGRRQLKVVVPGNSTIDIDPRDSRFIQISRKLD